MKEFNTTGICVPNKHYMVDISERVRAIKEMVDAGKYFVINRGRQYGKTTTLRALQKSLENEYIVLALDFQGIDEDVFENGAVLSKAIARLIVDLYEFEGLGISEKTLASLGEIKDSDISEIKMDDLFRALKRWMKESDLPIVLIIDEVDRASNNQVFFDFLAQLREGYIRRDFNGSPAFQSVILVGVTDIRHLKSRVRPDSEHKVNSPWNIASEFAIDMSLSEEGIRGMLDSYEADHRLGMDTYALAGQIYEYTSGYPFLVSRICQIIDKKLCVDEKSIFKDLSEAWTAYGVDEAVKLLLSEPGNALFESITGKLINYPDLKDGLRQILMRGEPLQWLAYDELQQELYMYGFIKNVNGKVAISNRIFEMLLYAHFLGENAANDDLKNKAAEVRSVFIDNDGSLDIPKIMSHFIKEHNIIHGNDDTKFLEAEGRERFMTYISAIINGTGTYSIEEATRDQRRMDLVIHYLGRRYIIEMKIWRGERYNEEGEKQIMSYLDYFGLSTGYLLSFNFNKDKKPGVERIQIEDKVIFEGTV